VKLSLAKLRVGTVIANKYKLDKIIGEGRGGVIFEATHSGSGRALAVRILESLGEADEAQQFMMEVKAAATLEHPNLVRVVDMGEAEDIALYIAYEILRGKNLAEHIGREGALSFSSVIQLLFPVMSGMAAAHRIGLVHRDLAPDNIVLARNAEGRTVAKLLDLGIIKEIGDTKYRAPEQLAHRSPTPATDVWSMGAVLYEALSGKPPFDGEDDSAIQEARFVSLAQASPVIPPQVADLIDASMRADPHQRYQDMRGFLKAMTDMAESLEISNEDRSMIQLSKTLAARMPVANKKETFPAAKAPPKMGESDRRPVIDAQTLAKVDDAVSKKKRQWSSIKIPIPVGAVVAALVAFAGIGAFTWMSGFEALPAPFVEPAQGAVADSVEPDLPPPVPGLPENTKSTTIAKLQIVSGEPPAERTDAMRQTEALDAKSVAQAQRDQCDQYKREVADRVRNSEADLEREKGPQAKAAKHDLDQLRAAKRRCDTEIFGGAEWVRAQNKVALGDELVKTNKLDRALKEYDEATAIEAKLLTKCKEIVENVGTEVAGSDSSNPPQPPVEEPRAEKGSAKTSYEKAKSLRDAGRIDEAIAELDKAIKIAPDFVAAYNSRGLAYQAKKDVKRAIADFDKAIVLDAKNASLYNNRAVAKEAAQDHAGAIDDLSKAIGIDGSKALFYEHRAEAEQAVGKLDRALEDYGAAIAKDPSRAETYFGRGEIEESQKSYTAAETDFSKVLELQPDRVEAYYRRGLARSQLGNNDAATKDFGEALRRDPKHAGSYLRRGYALVKLGRTKEAESDLVRYLQLEPESKFKPQVEKQIAKLQAASR
jgi:serine/threonine protein kinase/tetratricopeptide (TPR) repeat protein